MLQKISLDRFTLQGVEVLSREGESMTVRACKEGGTLLLESAEGKGPGGADWKQANYLICDLVTHGDHTVMYAFSGIAVYNDGKGWPDINFGIGTLPGYPVRVSIPLTAFQSGSLHVPRTPGRLTMYVTGKPLAMEDLKSFQIATRPCYEPIEFTISNCYLDDKEPEYLYPEIQLVDEMGQWIPKDWPEKVRSTEELNRSLRKLLEEAKAFPMRFPEGYSSYGGWEKMRFEATGYFRREKANGRWWLVDPEGCAFLSIGPDCVGTDRACYIKGMEQTLAWIPPKDDPLFAQAWQSRLGDFPSGSVDFPCANLIRAYGESWFEDWALTVKMRLLQWGFNTVANWSDERLYQTLKMPYVYPLSDFPGTRETIHRDFPDVFSEEYRRNSVVFAQQLKKFEEDPYLIGYFMRNEPTWAFAETLLIAEEMLANPASFASKDLFIEKMREKYGSVAALNEAWKLDLGSFEDLKQPRARLSYNSPEAHNDLKAFSIEMTREYVRVPALECKKVDQHHMNLGMRWAMIHNLDLLAGSEYLDVFSMNRYAVTPVDAIRSFEKRLDMPLLIGEFHFGCLDQGMTATGHLAPKGQAERGKAYRYYVETALAEPVCVGLHYFTYNDQGPIGRGDGENFQHGIVDCCQQPYQAFVDGICRGNAEAYAVAAGEQPPTEEMAEFMPCVN